MKKNPWRMVIGSHSPTLVLYENGYIIFESDSGYKQVHIDSLNIDISALTNVDISTSRNIYYTVNGHDHPTYVFWWKDKGFINIYGYLWNQIIEIPKPSWPEGRMTRKKEREYHWEESDYIFYNDVKKRLDSIPEIVKKTHESIIEIISTKASLWKPKYLEVMVLPTKHVPSRSIPWPEGWPDLESGSTEKRIMDSYCIHLPFELKDELIKLLKKRNKRPNSAILINGYPMALSYKYPFPNEERWMNQKAHNKQKQEKLQESVKD